MTRSETRTLVFFITRLSLIVSSVSVSTSNLPLPGLDNKKLLASGIGTRRLESGGASRERRGVCNGVDRPLIIWGPRRTLPGFYVAENAY